MTLAASGEMSIGGSTSTRSINLELGRAATATSSLNEAALRTLAGVSSGAISISSFYGKANFTVAYSAGFTNSYVLDDVFDSFASENASAGIRWNTNGTMDQFQYSDGYTGLGETWGSPTTTSIGSNYWIRFTRTAVQSIGSPTASTNSTASTGWLQLNTSREINIFRYPGQNQFAASWTVEISSDSGGATILSTRTGVTLVLLDNNI